METVEQEPEKEKLKLLFVDDEKESIDNFCLTFKRDFQIFTALSGQEAFEILKKEPDTAIILSDQRMPKMKGTIFLEKVAEKYPDTVRIIVTAFMDVKAAVAAINRGEVYRYILKPYEPDNMLDILQDAAEVYRTNKKNKELLKEFEDKSISLEELNAELSNIVSAHRHTLEDVEASEEYFRQLTETANDAIIVTDKKGRIVYWNSMATSMFGHPAKKAEGKTLSLIFPQGDKITNIEKLDAIASKKTPMLGAATLTLVGQRKGGMQITVEVTRGVFRTKDGSLYNTNIFRNVADRNRIENALRKKVDELTVSDRNREEINIALNAILVRREKENSAIEDRMTTIVNMLVLPYVDKLVKSNLTSTQMAYINIIETNLKELVAPIGKSSNSKYLDLTPKEMKIAGLIKEGKKNRDIAKVMEVSINTILFHRYNIRKKLGLLNAKKNLRSYLTTVPV